MIPTRRRVPIPHKMSYALGAGAISRGLEGVPQYADLALWFLGLPQARPHDRLKPYEVIRLEHCFVCREPFQWEWTIIVRPVPRALKPRIGEKILQQALPLMRERLEAASSQSRRDGTYTLEFLFDELRDELVRAEGSSTEWNTQQRRR